MSHPSAAFHIRLIQIRLEDQLTGVFLEGSSSGGVGGVCSAVGGVVPVHRTWSPSEQTSRILFGVSLSLVSGSGSPGRTARPPVIVLHLCFLS